MIEAAVLAAAYASPDDVQARLRYADRLAAQAQTEDQRAIPELIRAELRLENLPEGEPERRPLEERVTELTLPALRGWKALLGGSPPWRSSGAASPRALCSTCVTSSGTAKAWLLCCRPGGSAWSTPGGTPEPLRTALTFVPCGT